MDAVTDFELFTPVSTPRTSSLFIPPFSEIFAMVCVIVYKTSDFFYFLYFRFSPIEPRSQISYIVNIIIKRNSISEIIKIPKGKKGRIYIWQKYN